MYCHAMASLAVCEAYALSGDERLRRPAEEGRRVPGPVRGRPTGSHGGIGPGQPSGDTSLLGWAILVFKSAQAVGIPVPASMRAWCWATRN